MGLHFTWTETVPTYCTTPSKPNTPLGSSRKQHSLHDTEGVVSSHADADVHLTRNIPESCVAENDATLALSVAAAEKEKELKACDVPQGWLQCPTNEKQARFQGGAL